MGNERTSAKRQDTAPGHVRDELAAALLVIELLRGPLRVALVAEGPRAPADLGRWGRVENMGDVLECAPPSTDSQKC